MTHDPSRPDRDRALGDALRAALGDPRGDAAFVAAVMARTAPPVRDVLAAWSRWGIVAAAVVIAVALTAGPAPEPAASMDDALAGANGRAMILAGESSPGPDALYPDEDANAGGVR